LKIKARVCKTTYQVPQVVVLSFLGNFNPRKINLKMEVGIKKNYSGILTIDK
jgi:hypothetical protein